MTERRNTLSGSLGVGSIVFMVVAAAAPLAVVGGIVPFGLAFGNGPAFPATFVIAAIVLLLFAVGFCAMSPHVPNAGAFYSYVERGLGRTAGLGTAFLALGVRCWEPGVGCPKRGTSRQLTTVAAGASAPAFGHFASISLSGLIGGNPS